MDESKYAKESAIFQRLYVQIMDILFSMTPKQRRKADELEVIFVDVINGKEVGRAAYSIKDVIDAVNADSKPIGILVGDPVPQEVRAFPGISNIEEGILHAMLAESQDAEEDFQST